jgi:hypothetical protein
VYSVIVDAVGNAAIDELTVAPPGLPVDRMDETDEGVADVSSVLLEDELSFEEEAAMPIVVRIVGESGIIKSKSACGVLRQVHSLAITVLSRFIAMYCSLTNKKQHVFLSCAVVRQHVNTVEQGLRPVLTEAHAIASRNIVVQRADAETRT